MHWKLIKSEYVLRNKWISVRKDYVRLSSGVEIDDFYVIERPNIVYVVAINREGQFIFERQYRYAINHTCMEICAGNIEQNETPLEAAKRELLEETGYSGGEWELICENAVDPSNMTELSYSFVAKNVVKVADQHLDNTEHIETVLLSVNEVRQALRKGEIVSSQMAATLWHCLSLSGFEDLRQ